MLGRFGLIEGLNGYSWLRQANDIANMAVIQMNKSTMWSVMFR